MRILNDKTRHYRFSKLLTGLFWVLAGGLFVPAVLFAGHGAQGPSGKGKRISVYDRAGDWTMQSLDGKELSFSDCKGKVVFLNFWATWCIPCVEEMPAIAKLHAEFSKKEVVFLLVTDEKEGKVRKFLKKNVCDVPIYISKKKIPKMFKPKRYPLTFFLDKEGGIAFRCTGTASWDDPAYKDLLLSLTKR